MNANDYRFVSNYASNINNNNNPANNNTDGNNSDDNNSDDNDNDSVSVNFSILKF